MTTDLATGGRTPFERYGGFASVSRIVMSFYERVLDSDELAPWFENTDMRTLIDHQTKFVASLMGGPASYTDETLRRVHAPLGITRPAFEEMKRLLAEALDEHGIGERDAAAVLAEIERRGSLVVTA